MRDEHPSAEPAFDGLGGASADFTGAVYVNPVLDQDFPDPAIILAPDGFYYAYATQTCRGEEWTNIQVARSKDLVRWEQLGDALPDKPDWARTTQDFWAPSVLYDGSTYFMRDMAHSISYRVKPSRTFDLRFASRYGCRRPSADKGREH